MSDCRCPCPCMFDPPGTPITRRRFGQEPWNSSRLIVALDDADFAAVRRVPGEMSEPCLEHVVPSHTWMRRARCRECSWVP